jgi:hypothetical protein
MIIFSITFTSNMCRKQRLYLTLSDENSLHFSYFTFDFYIFCPKLYYYVMKNANNAKPDLFSLRLLTYFRCSPF